MINTTEPNAPPFVDFGTFSHPTDLTVATESLKKVRDWMASSPMQAIGARETYPGSNITGEAEIAAAIRQFAVSSWQHPTSTCSMMKREMGGVVDSELRVYGVKGLRVVDASIFPMVVAGHTSSTVYAVAEKVSVLSPTCVFQFFWAVLILFSVYRQQTSSRQRRHDQSCNGDTEKVESTG